MKAALFINGPKGAGKTLLTRLCVQLLKDTNLLLVDATADQELTQKMLGRPPKMVLADLVTQFGNMMPETPTNEAIDWSFQELPVSIGDQADLLTVGKLPEGSERLPEAILKSLQYGFKRLAKPYDLVLVDGFHPVLTQVFDPELCQNLLVFRPEQLSLLQLTSLIAHAGNIGNTRNISNTGNINNIGKIDNIGLFGHASALIINAYGDQLLPPELKDKLTQQGLTLIGKLPAYASNEQLVKELPDLFKNCLMRLDLPIRDIR